MRILLTRPLAQARETAAKLDACGHEVEIAPMLEIHPIEGPPLSSSDVAAVLFTSANGVRFGAMRLVGPEVPAFCVGWRTAEAARSAGFRTIEHAGGDAGDLARLVMSRLGPESGPLIHLCGRERKAELGQMLRAAGFEVREAPVYEARTAAALPDGLRERIETGDIDLVLVYSERAARRLAQLLDRGADPAGRIEARLGALSEAAARPLANRFCETVVADTPEETALLAGLARATGACFPAPKEAKSENGGE